MTWLVRLCAGLICVIFLYLAVAVVGALVPGPVVDVPGGDDVTVVLVAGPIHYDLILPNDAQTRRAFGFLADYDLPLESAEWIVVGWGSRAFYTATGTYRDLDARVIWDAATGDASVFRFDVAYGDWAAFGVPVTMSWDQYALLRGQILQGLARDGAGLPVRVPGASLTPGDVFLDAKSHFSILRTCNVWIGEILRGAGVSMGFWTPTPYAVTLSRWWFG